MFTAATTGMAQLDELSQLGPEIPNRVRTWSMDPVCGWKTQNQMIPMATGVDR